MPKYNDLMIELQCLRARIQSKDWTIFKQQKNIQTNMDLLYQAAAKEAGKLELWDGRLIF